MRTSLVTRPPGRPATRTCSAGSQSRGNTFSPHSTMLSRASCSRLPGCSSSSGSQQWQQQRQSAVAVAEAGSRGSNTRDLRGRNVCGCCVLQLRRQLCRHREAGPPTPPCPPDTPLRELITPRRGSWIRHRILHHQAKAPTLHAPLRAGWLPGWRHGGSTLRRCRVRPVGVYRTGRVEGGMEGGTEGNTDKGYMEVARQTQTLGHGRCGAVRGAGARMIAMHTRRHRTCGAGAAGGGMNGVCVCARGGVCWHAQETDGSLAPGSCPRHGGTKPRTPPLSLSPCASPASLPSCALTHPQQVGSAQTEPGKGVVWRLADHARQNGQRGVELCSGDEGRVLAPMPLLLIAVKCSGTAERRRMAGAGARGGAPRAVRSVARLAQVSRSQLYLCTAPFQPYNGRKAAMYQLSLAQTRRRAHLSLLQ